MSSALASPDLLGLRAELDRVDDALHDLLMRRAEIVTQVGALRAKGPVALRPGREASIVRRLLARNHGALDQGTIVRVWRDILSGSTAQQEAMVIAIADLALLPLVREHFGTPAVTCLGSDVEAVQAVAAGTASVAVLRWPGDWWTALLDTTAPQIVARLPFWTDDQAVDAMALTAAAPDPSGQDRTLIGARLEPAALRAALAAAGWDLAAPVIGTACFALAELDGFIQPSDPRLPRETEIVGAYAVQLGNPTLGHQP